MDSVLLTLGLVVCIAGIVLTWFSGFLSGDREETSSFISGSIAAVLLVGGVMLFIKNCDINQAKQETINSAQFRAGAIYEKLTEIQVEENFLAILKDSKGNIAVYKSPKKLPDKFIASELNDAVPIGGLVELGVERKEESALGVETEKGERGK